MNGRSIPKAAKSPECIAPSAFDTAERQQSAIVGSFNLISTMIGGGVLSLPFAMARSGLIVGFVVLTLSAIASAFSFDILVSAARRTGAMTYQQIGYFAFGPKTQSLNSLLILIQTFMVSIAYCVLIGDLMKPIVCYFGGISDEQCSEEWLRRLVIAVGILFVSPFCYQRQTKGLKYTSFMSIASVLILSVIIAMKTLLHFDSGHSIFYYDENGVNRTFWMRTDIHLFPESLEDVVYVFPVFGLSFTCHFNIPQVHSELTRPTRKRMRLVSMAVLSCCYLLYFSVAFFGYFYAFQYTCGNILLNYDQNDAIVSLARLCIGFVIIFTFPLLILPARASLHNLLNLVVTFPNMNIEDMDCEITGDDSLHLGDCEMPSNEVNEVNEVDPDTNIDALIGTKPAGYKLFDENVPRKQGKSEKAKNGKAVTASNKQMRKLQIIKKGTSATTSISPTPSKTPSAHQHSLSPSKETDISYPTSPEPSSTSPRSPLQTAAVPLSYNTFTSEPKGSPNQKRNASVHSKLMNKKPKIYSETSVNSQPEISRSRASLLGKIWKSNESPKDNAKWEVREEPREQSVGSLSKGFTTRSFSMLDSALRGPHDALGVINTPQDAESLRGMDFAKLFQNLEGAVNLTPTTPWLIVETTLLIGLALMVACMTQSVMVVWAVVGSTVTFVIAFLLPALYYRYVFPFLKIRWHKGWTMRNIAALFTIIGSSIAMVLCTWQAVLRLDAQPCPNQPTFASH